MIYHLPSTIYHLPSTSNIYQEQHSVNRLCACLGDQDDDLATFINNVTDYWEYGAACGRRSYYLDVLITYFSAWAEQSSTSLFCNLGRKLLTSVCSSCILSVDGR